MSTHYIIMMCYSVIKLLFLSKSLMTPPLAPNPALLTTNICNLNYWLSVDNEVTILNSGHPQITKHEFGQFLTPSLPCIMPLYQQLLATKKSTFVGHSVLGLMMIRIHESRRIGWWFAVLASAVSVCVWLLRGVRLACQSEQQAVAKLFCYNEQLTLRFYFTKKVHNWS